MKKHIILDFGNGNNHNNDLEYVKKMIDETRRIQNKTKYQLIVKFQIWSENNSTVSEQLKSTTWDIFDQAFWYCGKKEIDCTTSVFDSESKEYLLDQFPVRYIKIACRPQLYNLIDERSKYIVSVSNYEDKKMILEAGNIPLYCVPKYPAMPLDYINLFTKLPDFDFLDPAITGFSDHTKDFGLFKIYNPYWYECHISLEKNENDPFGGDFIRTFKQLEEALWE